MAVRTEFEALRIERERVARRMQPAKDRAVIRWFMRAPEPATDHFVWLDPFEAAPPITEFEDR